MILDNENDILTFQGNKIGTSQEHLPWKKILRNYQIRTGLYCFGVNEQNKIYVLNDHKKIKLKLSSNIISAVRINLSFNDTFTICDPLDDLFFLDNNGILWFDKGLQAHYNFGNLSIESSSSDYRGIKLVDNVSPDCDHLALSIYEAGNTLTFLYTDQCGNLGALHLNKNDDPINKIFNINEKIYNFQITETDLLVQTNHKILKITNFVETLTKENIIFDQMFVLCDTKIRNFYYKKFDDNFDVLLVLNDIGEVYISKNGEWKKFNEYGTSPNYTEAFIDFDEYDYYEYDEDEMEDVAVCIECLKIYLLTSDGFVYSKQFRSEDSLGFYCNNFFENCGTIQCNKVYVGQNATFGTYNREFKKSIKSARS